MKFLVPLLLLVGCTPLGREADILTTSIRFGKTYTVTSGFYINCYGKAEDFTYGTVTLREVRCPNSETVYSSLSGFPVYYLEIKAD